MAFIESAALVDVGGKHPQSCTHALRKYANEYNVVYMAVFKGTDYGQSIEVVRPDKKAEGQKVIALYFEWNVKHDVYTITEHEVVERGKSNRIRRQVWC